MATLVQTYFDNFGNKACCFEDLKPYVTETAPLHGFINYLELIPKSFVSYLPWPTNFYRPDYWERPPFPNCND